MRPIAWIYAGNAKGKGEVDLSDIEVRRRMVSEALWLVKDCGFAGVQWDYEICPDKDPHFLSLMHETRAALPNGSYLGVAAPVTYPRPFQSLGWSEDYYGELAKVADCLSVMVYDTGAYFPRAYVWLTSEQVVRISRAVAKANPSCKVVFGVPTYGQGLRSHNPHAENLRLAIVGLRKGMSSPQAASEVIAGAAIFADYTADPTEWLTWRSQWLQQN